MPKSRQSRMGATTAAHVRRSQDLCLRLDHRSLPPITSKEPAQPLLFQHCYLLEWRFWNSEKGEPTLEGNWASSDPNLRSSAPTTVDLIPTSVGWKWPLSRGEALAQTGSGSSHCISSLTSYHGDSCQHSLEKDLACIHVKSSSPIKATGHTQTV